MMRTATAPVRLDEDVTAIDLLRELVAGQQQIIRLLERQPRPSPGGLSRDDLAIAERLLPVVAGVFGPELFNSAEVCDHPSPALRLVLAGLNAMRLGRLFRRLADTPVGGYLVQRQGSEAGAILWRVVAVPDFPQNKKVSVPLASSRDRS